MLAVRLKIGIDLWRYRGKTNHMELSIVTRVFDYFPVKVLYRQILINISQIHLEIGKYLDRYAQYNLGTLLRKPDHRTIKAFFSNGFALEQCVLQRDLTCQGHKCRVFAFRLACNWN